MRIWIGRNGKGKMVGNHENWREPLSLHFFFFVFVFVLFCYLPVMSSSVRSYMVWTMLDFDRFGVLRCFLDVVHYEGFSRAL